MKIKKHIIDLMDDAISLIYPRLCAACGINLYKNEKHLCFKCLFKLPKSDFHLEKENPVEQLFWGRLNFERASAFLLFRKKGSTQRVIHQFKYKGDRELGNYLGRLYGNDLIAENAFQDIDFIIPVPLHPRKQKKRGFNQSEIFAKGLSESMKIALDTKTLFRKIYSDTQTRKARYERWQNVGNIFSLQNSDHLKGKHILLVDDVVTTGATAEACGQMLFKIPDVKLSLAFLAYNAG